MVDGRFEPHVRLPHAHADPAEGKALEQRLRDGPGERLEEREPAAVRDGAHAGDDVSVVDRVRKVVGPRARVVGYELEVEEEALPALPFLVGSTVMAEELEAVDLDYDVARSATPSIAWTALSASTCGRTSCTRKSDAPRW